MSSQTMQKATLPVPYYEDDAVTIYHAGCREILPLLQPADAIITDPAWPNGGHLFGAGDPAALLAEAIAVSPPAKRLIIHLGGLSDPRFLAAVPPSLPFMRVCWLAYARPNYYGRFLHQGDVAYVFGEPPRPRKGYTIIPAQTISTDSNGRENEHPAPRKLAHVRWLVKWFSAEDEMIPGPFMGSGTTLRAAKDAKRKVTGIEIDERWCELAVRRMAQGVLL